MATLHNRKEELGGVVLWGKKHKGMVLFCGSWLSTYAVGKLRVRQVVVWLKGERGDDGLWDWLSNSAAQLFVFIQCQSRYLLSTLINS